MAQRVSLCNIVHQDWLTDERGWEVIPCSHPRHVDQIQSTFASIHWTQVGKETYSVSVSEGQKGVSSL